MDRRCRCGLRVPRRSSRLQPRRVGARQLRGTLGLRRPRADRRSRLPHAGGDEPQRAVDLGHSRTRDPLVLARGHLLRLRLRRQPAIPVDLRRLLSRVLPGLLRRPRAAHSLPDLPLRPQRLARRGDRGLRGDGGERIDRAPGRPEQHDRKRRDRDRQPRVPGGGSGAARDRDLRIRPDRPAAGPGLGRSRDRLRRDHGRRQPVHVPERNGRVPGGHAPRRTLAGRDAPARARRLAARGTPRRPARGPIHGDSAHLRPGGARRARRRALQGPQRRRRHPRGRGDRDRVHPHRASASSTMPACSRACAPSR